MTGNNPQYQYPTFTPRSTSQAMPQPTAQNNQPRLLYFITRGNSNLVVPLVPADELPFNVRLQGVPRVLSLEQASGMQNVGYTPYHGMTFKLESPVEVQRSGSQPPVASHVRSHSGGASTSYLAPDALARQALAQSAANAAHHSNITPTRPLSAHEVAKNWRSNLPSSALPSSSSALVKYQPTNTTDSTQALLDAIVASTSGAAQAAQIGYVPKATSTVPPSGTVPDENKKEFCTYWIRTGECDYMQQGCLYKHEMPDQATLAKIGFRTTPSWWLEKQSVIRLKQGGGEKPSVGPVMKSEEWLRKRRESDSGDESGSEGEVSSKSSVQEEAKKPMVILKKPRSMPPLEPVRLLKHNEQKPEAAPKTDSKQVIQHPIRHIAPATPTIDIRKASTTSENLIDFTPPSPPPSSASLSPPPSLTPCSSASSLPSTGKTTPLLPSTRTPSPSKIFVPKGETAATHIAEARKRAARSGPRQHDSCGSDRPVSSQVAPIEKQIQTMQQRQHIKPNTVHGLMASKHAPRAEDETKEDRKKVELPGKRTKTSLRIRRPAPVAAVGKGKENAIPTAKK